MNEAADNPAIAPLDVGLAADRLLGAIDAACESPGGFAERLDAALGAGLALFAREPELIAPLASRDVGEPASAAQSSAWASCAARLRAAAERAGVEAGGSSDEQPRFVEKFLVGAMRFELLRALRQGETSLLPGRAGDLRDFVLAYYADPVAS